MDGVYQRYWWLEIHAGLDAFFYTDGSSSTSRLNASDYYNMAFKTNEVQ